MDLGLSARALLLLALLPASTAAQSNDDRADHEQARALFERGTAAVHAGRFIDARIDLEQSLALVPHPSTAFNLVVALRGLGEAVEAADVCSRALEPQLDTLDASRREEARTLCADVRAAVAHLTVRAIGATPFELRVDGRSLGQLAPPESLEQTLDPGDHVLTVLARGSPPDDHAVALPPGARITLELSADEGSGELDVPLVVALASGGVAVAAGLIVAIAVGAASSGESDDYPVVATLVSF